MTASHWRDQHPDLQRSFRAKQHTYATGEALENHIRTAHNGRVLDATCPACRELVRKQQAMKERTNS